VLLLSWLLAAGYSTRRSLVWRARDGHILRRFGTQCCVWTTRICWPCCGWPWLTCWPGRAATRRARSAGGCCLRRARASCWAWSFLTSHAALIPAAAMTATALALSSSRARHGWSVGPGGAGLPAPGLAVARAQHTALRATRWVLWAIRWRLWTTIPARIRSLPPAPAGGKCRWSTCARPSARVS
jgi:hypothetical protein